MFSTIATSDFFIMALVAPAGIACVVVMAKKFVTDMKAQKKLVKGPMAVRNK